MEMLIFIESTSKCKSPAKLGIMIEKDLIRVTRDWHLEMAGDRRVTSELYEERCRSATKETLR